MKKLWGYLSYLGVSDDLDMETARRTVLLNRIAVTLFVLVFCLRVFVTINDFQSFSYTSIIAFIAMFGILTIPLLNKLGYYKYNSFTLSSLAPICALFFSVSAQSTNETVTISHYIYPRIFTMSLLVLPLVLIDSKERVLQAIAIVINVLCIINFDKIVGIVGVPFDHTTVDFSNYELISKMMMLPMAVMILAFLFLTNLNKKYEEKIIGLNDDLKAKNQDLKQYNEEVSSQRDLISSKNELLEKTYNQISHINKDLTDSILYAKNIQNAVLDTELLKNEYFTDSFVYFKAKLHVSGDFYFSKKLTINGKKAVVVSAVDCTGHGVPGGFLSMLGITLLNEILDNEYVTNASEILDHLREKVKKALNQTGKQSDQKDGMEMALCLYFPDTKQLHFAGARNPLCMVKPDSTCTKVKGDRQPIGIYEKEYPFTNHLIQLEGNEMLYMFSDGIQDQFGGNRGKKLKYKSLESVLIQNSHLSCSDQKEHFKAFIHNWMSPLAKAKQKQIDDMVLIGIRV